MEKRKIDDIFKEGLDHPDIPFNEDNWDKLEARLDQPDSRSKPVVNIWWKTAGIAAAIALAFLFGKDFLFPSNVPKSTENLTKTTVAKKDTMSGQVVSRAADQFKNGDTILKSRFYKEQRKQPVISKVVEAFVGQPTETAGENITSLKNSAYPEELKLLEETSQVSKILSKDTAKITDLEPVIGQENVKKGLAQNLEIDSVDKESIGADKNLAPKRGVLSILAAPDLTSVRGWGKSSWSTNVGVLYTHPVYKNISVSSGLIYSRKNYSSPFSFYKPEQALPPGYNPTNVSAVCDILSVPVLVNMDLIRTKNNSITFSAGASSYFMLRENYTFSYTDQADRVYEIRNKNKHYFGVADVSLTFEQRLSNKLMIGVRPFYQIPLVGIGYGRTSLQSKGLALTLGIGL